MLRSLATASDGDLWATFGDVISKWEGVGKEKVWTDKFRTDMGSTAMAEMMMKIRTALATIQLEYVPPSSVSDFASYTASNEEDIQHAVAMHYRSASDVDTIFFLPFLVRVDLLLASGTMSPETGSRPGCDVDALIVSTAKATLHEARNLVGTLVRPFFLSSFLSTLNMISDPWHRVSHRIPCSLRVRRAGVQHYPGRGRRLL
jgi:hypothetical protein